HVEDEGPGDSDHLLHFFDGVGHDGTRAGGEEGVGRGVHHDVVRDVVNERRLRPNSLDVIPEHDRDGPPPRTACGDEPTRASGWVNRRAARSTMSAMVPAGSETHHVMVVDDDALIRTLMTAFLAKLGCR